MRVLSSCPLALILNQLKDHHSERQRSINLWEIKRQYFHIHNFSQVKNTQITKIALNGHWQKKEIQVQISILFDEKYVEKHLSNYQLDVKWQFRPIKSQ